MTETRPGPPALPHGHPDLDTLADFDAGVLDAAHSARLRSHVSACTRCRAILAGISDVPHLLRQLPPPHIPPEVEARIFAALDAERLARSGPAAAPGPGPAAAAVPTGRAAAAGPVAGLQAARQRRRGRTRLIGMVAAGLVVIAGGATAVIGLSGSNRSDTGAGSSALDSKHPPGVPPPAKSLGLPSYDRQTITSSPLLTRILNGERGPLVAGGDALSGARLNSCVSGVARTLQGLSGGPQGMEHINFEGQWAYLLAYAGSSGRVLVVVGESCAAGDPDVLFTRSL